MITTLQDLFTFVLRHETTLVFGNLGRKPHVVYQFLAEQLSGVDVVVVSPHYSFPTSGDQRIRTIEANNTPVLSTVRCDLLVFLEPLPYSHVTQPVGVGRTVVLSSHLMFTDFYEDRQRPPTLVAYFDGISPIDTIEKTRRLLRLQDVSMQTNNVNHIRPPGGDDSMPIQVIDGGSSTTNVGIAPPTVPVLENPTTYVVVDLTRHTSPYRLYLAFWDAFDAMLRNVDSVGRWVVGFPERNGAKAFEQLAQDVIDRIYCTKFEHGNVVSSQDRRDSLKMLLSVLPFYKSGVIDPKSFDVPTSTFCGIEYTAPENPEDVYRAGTKHNLEHWVGSVYRIL